jgi:hypothetical protein
MMNKLIPSASRIPLGYFVGLLGVFYRSHLLTRTPIWVSAIASDGRGHSWDYELSWLTPEGRLQSVVISAAMLHVSNQCFQRMMRRFGIELENRILKFRQYLFLFCDLVPRKIAKPDLWLDSWGYKYKVMYAANIKPLASVMP